MVNSEIRGAAVKLENWTWTAKGSDDDAMLLDELKTAEALYWATGPRYAPNRERDVMEFVINELGTGRILEDDYNEDEGSAACIPSER